MNRYTVILRSGGTVTIYSQKPVSVINELAEGDSFFFNPDDVSGLVDVIEQQKMELVWWEQNAGRVSKLMTDLQIIQRDNTPRAGEKPKLVVPQLTGVD